MNFLKIKKDPLPSKPYQTPELEEQYDQYLRSRP